MSNLNFKAMPVRMVKDDEEENVENNNSNSDNNSYYENNNSSNHNYNTRSSGNSWFVISIVMQVIKLVMRIFRGR